MFGGQRLLSTKKEFDFQETFSLVVKPRTIQTMLDIGDT
jgi:hypothetical protein